MEGCGAGAGGFGGSCAKAGATPRAVIKARAAVPRLALWTMVIRTLPSASSLERSPCHRRLHGGSRQTRGKCRKSYPVELQDRAGNLFRSPDILAAIGDTNLMRLLPFRQFVKSPFKARPRNRRNPRRF